jgi:hypothetical protein
MLGHRQLPDVVEQCGGFNGAQFRPPHAQLPGQPDRIHLQAAQMGPRITVFGINGQRQRVNRAQVEVGVPLRLCPLLLQAKDQVQRRYRQQQDLPRDAE